MTENLNQKELERLGFSKDLKSRSGSSFFGALREKDDERESKIWNRAQQNPLGNWKQVLTSEELTTLDVFENSNRDRSGASYLSKLDKKWSVINRSNQFLGGESVKQLDLAEIVARKPHTLVVIGKAWKLLTWELGPSSDEPPAPIMPLVDWKKKFLKRRQPVLEFVENLYAAWDKLQYLCSLDVVPDDTRLFGKSEKPELFWSSLKLKKHKRLSEAFREAHNRNVEQFQALVDNTPPDCPRYPNWGKNIYRARLVSDTMLNRALQLRQRIEEELVLLRTSARLLTLGVSEILPIYEESERSKWRHLGHRYQRKKLRFESEHLKDSLLPNEPTSKRSWAVGIGDVDLSPNITCTPINSIPAAPTESIIGPKEALIWAFIKSTDAERLRFTVGQSDQYTIVFDFNTLSVTLSCVRFGTSTNKVLQLDKLFKLPNAESSYDSQLEFKLLNEVDCQQLDDMKKSKAYLHWSIKKGHLESAFSALERVAEVDCLDKDGFSALQLAVIGDHHDIAQGLLRKGANVNLQNRQKNSPCHLAISHDHPQMALLLVEQGASVSIENELNVTPLESFTSQQKRQEFFLTYPISEKAITSNQFELWFHMIQIEDIDNFKEKILEYVQLYPYLGFAKDKNGRVAIDMATPPIKAAINSVFLWFGRYRVTESRPEHQSATCLVFKGSDEGDLDESGNARPVAIKLMRVKQHFRREVDVRKRGFSSEFVIDIKARYPATDEELDKCPDEGIDFSEANFKPTKKIAEQYFCIVMPLGNRNLFVALKQERFAGRDMEEVRHVFIQLLYCVRHMHEKGALHADIKTLNVVRVDTQWKLIDMDATCEIDNDPIGSKSSSAYIPPEAIIVDETTNTVAVRNPLKLPTSQHVTAHPSFDVWSLGCILYQLCNKDVRPLLQGGQDDNISIDPSEDDNLFALAEWSHQFKTRKLSRIQDPLARNLLTQMLSKEPSTRPSIQRILAHPFLSSKKVARMVGQQAGYDVFISYRVASDLHHAELLYNLLTKQGVKVWWDRACLQPGVEWKEGFCAGLVNSFAFIPLMSRLGINHPDVPWQNFSLLTVDSRCDNVYLEYRLALELRGLGLIEKVFPIMIGDYDGKTEIYSNFFASKCLPTAPLTHVESVEADLKLHMESQALGSPLRENRHVADVLTDLMACQGGAVQGNRDAAFESIVTTILRMLKSNSSGSDDVSSTASALESNKRVQEDNEEVDAIRPVETANGEVALVENGVISRKEFAATPGVSRIEVQRSILVAKDNEIKELQKKLVRLQAENRALKANMSGALVEEILYDLEQDEWLTS